MPHCPPDPVTLCALNEQRRAARLPALRSVGTLTRAAQQHTRVMVAQRLLAHGNLKRRLRAYTASRRFAVGENIGTLSGRSTVTRIVSAWMRSPRHRRHILTARFRDVGIGMVRRSTTGGAGATFTTSFGWRSAG